MGALWMQAALSNSRTALLCADKPTGYGSSIRRAPQTGIVDECCFRSCDLRRLEMYCAPLKPTKSARSIRAQRHTDMPKTQKVRVCGWDAVILECSFIHGGWGGYVGRRWKFCPIFPRWQVKGLQCHQLDGLQIHPSNHSLLQLIFFIALDNLTLERWWKTRTKPVKTQVAQWGLFAK